MIAKQSAEPLSPPENNSRAKFRLASEIDEKPVHWLWHHRFVAGAINMLVGMPDAGKSVLTCDIAARVSTGTSWPAGDHRDNSAGDVIIISSEDSAEQTIRPRLRAAGADLNRVHIFESIVDDRDRADQFDIRRDMCTIAQHKLENPSISLVILDALDSFIPRVDSRAGNEVRAAMYPMRDVAEQFGLTFLLVHHPNKGTSSNAIDRISGSRSFGALPRTVWAIGKRPGNSDESLMLPIKANLVPARARKGMAFALKSASWCTDHPVVEWIEGDVDMEAGELFGGERVNRGDKLQQAIEWLEDLLFDEGFMLADNVKSRAAEAGISERTLARAKKELCVEGKPDGFGGAWTWRLPAVEETECAEVRH